MSDGMYNPQAFGAAHARLTRAPAELTDADLEQLAIIDPALAQHGFEQRFKALHPDPAPVPRTAQPLAAPPPPAREPMDEATADQFAEAVVALIAANIKPLVARLDEQQQRIAALEPRITQLEQQQKAAPAVSYRGVYESGAVYKAGELTTRAGGLWLAKRQTSQTPGQSQTGTDPDFVLIVKRGAA
jgi:hypothetical protein